MRTLPIFLLLATMFLGCSPADHNIRDDMTPLHFAAMNGNEDEVKSL